MANDETTILWPDVPATLFGGSDKEPLLNACVSWVLSKPKDIHGYKEGYRKAATKLFECARRRECSPDYLVWPIAWLWRHYLELALKEIIAIGGQLEGHWKPWEFPHGHRLRKLWDAARKHIEPMGDSDGAPVLNNVEAIINEFDGVDPDATGFRYPITRDGKRNLPNAPNYINLAMMNETMQRIANFLDSIHHVMSDYRDELLQQLYDSQTSEQSES